MFTATPEAHAKLVRAADLLREAQELIEAAGFPSSPSMSIDVKNALRDVRCNVEVFRP